MNLSSVRDPLADYLPCPINRSVFGVLFVLLLLALGAGCSSEIPLSTGPQASLEEPVPALPKPNIVLLLIDDMGVNDLGIDGNSSVRTPNLNTLAARGVRYTRHYVDSTCTATRVGILTGMPPAALGFRPNQLGISPEVDTLPDLLRSGGYSTHHIGKWHLGSATHLAWPLQQGFDTFFGFLSQFLLRGPHSGSELIYGRPTYLNPWLQVDNGKLEKHEGHLSELITLRAEQLLDSKRGVESPWFLNFWTYAPHDPVQPLDKFAQHYPNTPEGKYLAFIEQLDATVGRVIAALERNGLTENTLLLVASDNGGTNKYVDNNAPFNGSKMSYLEGGVRTPLIVYWPKHFEGGEAFDGIVSNFDYLPTLLSAAGIEVPSGLPGRDLRRVQSEDIANNQPLFWEMSNSDVHSWGVLSADGQWRLSQFFVGEPVLHNLLENPVGDKDVLSLHPQKTSELLLEYQGWRHAQRVVPFDYELLSAGGRARLTGQSLQRNPGYAGNTFAIAVSPQARAEAAMEEFVSDQLIAYQENQWQLKIDDSRLVLSINGIDLEAEAPPAGECSSIVISSHFIYSYINPKRSRAMIELYVSGKRVAQISVPDPSLPSDSYLAPTFIGQNADGQNLFLGDLGRPVILNERLVGLEDQSDYLANGVNSLPVDVCET